MSSLDHFSIRKILKIKEVLWDFRVRSDGVKLLIVIIHVCSLVQGFQVISRLFKV